MIQMVLREKLLSVGFLFMNSSNHLCSYIDLFIFIFSGQNEYDQRSQDTCVLRELLKQRQQRAEGDRINFNWVPKLFLNHFITITIYVYTYEYT